MEPGGPKEFVYFPQLPTEIKIMIWCFCMHDEHEQPGLQFFDLYLRPGYLCHCGECTDIDAQNSGVSVSMPPLGTPRNRHLHARYERLARNPRYWTQYELFCHAFDDAIRMVAAQKISDFHSAPGWYLEMINSYPHDFSQVRNLADAQALETLRQHALEYHAMPCQELGISRCSNSVPWSSGHPGPRTNPSAYLTNAGLSCMDDLAEESVAKYRRGKPQEHEIREPGDGSRTKQVKPLGLVSRHRSLPDLYWNASDDLICLRPRKTVDGAFDADLSDLDNIALIKCMGRHGRKIALAIEFDPGWSALQDHVRESIYTELANLTNFVLSGLTRESRSRVLYLIDWRIRLRDGTSPRELGDPAYVGHGVGFYEVAERATRGGNDLRRLDNSRHFCPLDEDILSLVGLLSKPENLRGQRHISFRILATA